MKNIKWILCLLLAGYLFTPALGFAATYTVQLKNFSFNPSTLTIGTGDTVVWTNTTSTTTHTSTSGSSCTGDGLWGGSLSPHAVFSFTFTGYAANNYPYFCTPHCGIGMTGSLTITSAVISPPAITLTSPTNGTRLLAPADFTLMANATQTGGTITNVKFLSGSTPIGDVDMAPYNLDIHGAPAGNYQFSAIAQNNQGTAATSSVVNVYLLTSGFLSDAGFNDGQFQLTLHGIAGQTYTTEASTDLLHWAAVSTNVAPADTFTVSDPSATNVPQRFYRSHQTY